MHHNSGNSIITFCVSRRRRKMYCGHARLCVCLCVCLSVCLSAAVRPHYCTDPDVTWVHGRGCPLVVHYWGRFAIGARVALLWQHNPNPSYKLASIPRYDDIVRTAGWAGSARAAGRWLAGDGDVLKIVSRIWQVGVAGSPVIGRRRGRSQHYCGGLDCGLPLMAFWQQKANAKC